ncbi:MAG: hypothetical protein M1835_000466, partial [Candelina submexicana]
MNPLSVGDATVDDEAGHSSIAGHGHQAESSNGTTRAEHGGSGEQVATVASGEDENASEVTQTPGNIHGAVAEQHGLDQAASTMATHSRRDVMLALGVTDQRSCARVQKRILRSAAFDDDDMEAGGAAVAASRAEQARRMEELVSEHEGPFTPSDVDTNSVYSTDTDKGKGKALEAGGRSRRDSTRTEESETLNRPSYLEYAEMVPP